jgi:hypothetical protein
MYVMIKFTNSWGLKLTAEQYCDVSLIPQIAKDMDPWKSDGPEEQEPRLYGEYLIDMIEDAPILINVGLKFEVIRFKNAYIPSQAGRYSDRNRQGPSNPTVQISIPNIGLLAMDEVQVLEDACTDELQRNLDAGWRIVAVCPPNAARRPDYVLGRTKGDK